MESLIFEDFFMIRNIMNDESVTGELIGIYK